MTVRIAFADDHSVVRMGLRAMLDEDPGFKIVGEATTGMEAVEIAVRLRPDVLLMDLRMPELDGVAATARIRTDVPEVNVLVLTTYDTDADILRAIEAGAAGYLLKDATRDELLRAIRTAARGQSVLAPAVASRLMRRAQMPTREVLTGREIEILAHVARGRSNREIGAALHVSEATVKSHLVHIFGKLRVQDRTEAVTVALDRGILRLEP